MKKVLNIITTAFVPYSGLTTVAMNYYRNIAHEAFQIDFASSNDCPQSLEEELKDNGSRYYKLPNRTKSPLSYMKKLCNICHEYDAVHIHGNSATTVLELIPAKLAGVKKRIVHIHNTKSDHVIIHIILYPVMKYLMTDAIACSDTAGKWIFKDYIVLNNAIETDKYAYNRENRIKIRELLGVEEGMFLLGNVGKVNEQKNHLFLLDIFKKYKLNHPDSKLLIIGDGVMRPSLEEKIKVLSFEKDVILTGMLNDVAPYYSAMDAFLFPSLWEGFPLSLIEAQANGLQCISSTNVTEESNVTGKVMYLDLVQVNAWSDAVKITDALDRIRESTENVQLLAKNGFDIKTNAKELEKIYER